MIIRDPRSGIGQGVSVSGMAMVKAASQEMVEYVNRKNEQSFSAVITATPTGAGDCFFYIKNNDNLMMEVTSLKLHAPTAEMVEVKLGDTGTAGGTHAALTPVNRNAGSGKVADVTCESGVDITGLSGGSVVDALAARAGMYRWEWRSGLILPKNWILSLYAVNGAIEIRATLGFCFLSTDMEP